MDTPTRILREVSKKFTRQDILKIIVQRGYSVSYANSIIENLTHSGKAQRIGQGKYIKTD